MSPLTPHSPHSPHSHRVYWLADHISGCRHCSRVWERRGDRVWTRATREDNPADPWTPVDWDSADSRPWFLPKSDRATVGAAQPESIR